MGQFGPAPFGQRRRVEFVDVDAREIFARQRVVPFVHLYKYNVLYKSISYKLMIQIWFIFV